MITAQDIREKGFERVRLNGYDMAAVDDFLEELADDVAASQKENAVLKSKMKVPSSLRVSFLSRVRVMISTPGAITKNVISERLVIGWDRR